MDDVKLKQEQLGLPGDEIKKLKSPDTGVLGSGVQFQSLKGRHDRSCQNIFVLQDPSKSLLPEAVDGNAAHQYQDGEEQVLTACIQDYHILAILIVGWWPSKRRTGNILANIRDVPFLRAKDMIVETNKLKLPLSGARAKILLCKGVALEDLAVHDYRIRSVIIILIKLQYGYNSSAFP
ncbi:hypothetical protein CUMW_270030 [Citrus unshiu]|uniref:Uncharacterized protein n=1 Tax=Citrus unshiu TaxID=55188 RepID=A0A2H5QX48_CITUN|nr:hypothetical protein CUMW_270030 [Citrus unshiu]